MTAHTHNPRVYFPYICKKKINFQTIMQQASNKNLLTRGCTQVCSSCISARLPWPSNQSAVRTRVTSYHTLPVGFCTTVLRPTVYTILQCCGLQCAVYTTLCAVQYSTLQYSTVQYSTLQYSTVQCSSRLVRVLVSLLFRSPRCIPLPYTTSLHCTEHCTVHCTVRCALY